MATVRELITVWGFDVDQTQLKKMEGNIRALKGELKSTFKTVGLGLATMFGFAKFTANAGEAAVKGGKKLGLATEAYQKYIYMVGLAEMGTEEFGTGFLFMARNAADASRKMSGETAKAFRRIGVDPRKAREDYDAFFMDVMAGLNNVKDVGDRASITRSIFGRGGDGFINVANMSREELEKLKQESVDVGYVMSGESAEAAERFNDNLKRLQFTGAGLRNIVGNALIPEMDNLVRATIKWAVENRQVIRTNIQGTVHGIVEVIKGAIPVISGVVKGTMSVVKILGGAERVTKLLLWGWIAFKGLKIGTFLFQLARNAWLFVAPLMKMSVLMKTLSFLGTALKIIFSKLAFAFMLAALWIQDFWVFAKGGDSATGRIFKNLLYIFQDMGLALREFLNLLGKIPGYGFYKKISSGLGSLGIGESGNAHSLRGIGLSPTAMASVNNSKKAVQINSPVTVNVPPGTPPEAVPKAVQLGVRDALSQMLRDTGRDLKPIEAT